MFSITALPMRRAHLALPVLSLVVLSACGATTSPTTSAPPSSSASSAATLSEVTVRGTIRPIQVKLYDVGTHVLVSTQSNELLYILASSAVDLGAHVGEDVELRGTTMPLGGGQDRLLSVSALTSLAATDALIETAKRLAASGTPPYFFTAADTGEILSRDETGAAIRISQSIASYVVRLSLENGVWVLKDVQVENAPSSIPSSAPSSLPSSSITPSSLPSSTPSSLPRSSIPPSSSPRSSAPPATPVGVAIAPSVSAGDGSAVEALANGLPALLSSAGVTASDPRATKISLTTTKRAYVVYRDGEALGMLLVGWSSDPANATVLATFAPGETSDWMKVTGDNVAKAEAVTIFSPKNGLWTAEITTAAGYSVYKSTTLKFSMQYPSHWYFALQPAVAPATSRLAFSDKPVTADNVLVSLEIVPGALDSVVANYSGVSAKTVGGKDAFSGSIASGATVLLIARNASSVFVLTAQPTAAGRLDVIASSLTSE